MRFPSCSKRHSVQIVRCSFPLWQLVEATFSFLIPILAGYIAMSIADRPGLLPGMAGGYLAVQANAGFLGGLIAGFLAGYIMVYLKKAFKGLPRTLDGMKTILLYPVFGLLITGLLMYFLVGPVFSTINTAMITFLENLGTGNAVLLGAVLGGMMAIDMGGPFNKAAYAFSIGIFTDTGDGSLMAAVMAGGMIPPLAIGIATLLFKKQIYGYRTKIRSFQYLVGVCPLSLKVRFHSLRQIRCALSDHLSLVQRLQVV